MKTRKLRLLSFVLAVAMMFAVMPVSAFAEGAELPELGTGEFDYHGLRYKKLNDTDVAVVGPVAMWDGELEIPEEAFDSEEHGYTVTEIADLAFNCWISDEYYTYKYVDRTKRLSVIIPRTVTRIGKYAFNFCTEANKSFWSDINAGKMTEIGLKNVTFAPGSQLETIDDYAFANCFSLAEIEIPNSVTTIGEGAFWACTDMEKVTFQKGSLIQRIGKQAFHYDRFLKNIELPEGLKQIPDGMFEDCYSLEEIVIPEGVTTIENGVFSKCIKLKKVTLPSTLKTIGNSTFDQINTTPEIYYTGTKEQLSELTSNNNYDWLAIEKIKYAHTVTFNNGDTADEQTVVVPYEETVTAPDARVKGYRIVGYYADPAYNTKFDFDTKITEDTTIYVKWEKIPDHQLTVTGGTFTVKDENVETKTEGDTLMADIPEGAEVTVTFHKDAYADSNLTFDGWKIEGLVNAENYTNKEEFNFTMPKNGVTIAAQTKAAAPAEDDSLDAATVVTGVVLGTGTAILAYHIGTEVYAEQVLGKGVAIPRTREEVALKAWELAGKPAVELNGEPLSEAAQAEKWAVESGLMQNDAEGSFNGAKKMSKLKALRTLDAAKKLG